MPTDPEVRHASGAVGSVKVDVEGLSGEPHMIRIISNTPGSRPYLRIPNVFNASDLTYIS